MYAKGQQMVDVLNKLNIDAACIGIIYFNKTQYYFLNIPFNYYFLSR